MGGSIDGLILFGAQINVEWYENNHTEADVPWQEHYDGSEPARSLLVDISTNHVEGGRKNEQTLQSRHYDDRLPVLLSKVFFILRLIIGVFHY